MTNLRAAAQQALQAMRRSVPTGEITLAEWMKANHDLEAALAEPQESDDKDTAGIRWQLCLLAQTEEFSDDVRNQIARGVWLIDRLRCGAEPVQEPVAVTVEAVAEVIEKDGEPELCWLIEGGIYALAEGDILMIAHRSITGDDGSGEVYTSPPQRKPLSEEEIKAALISVDSETKRLPLGFRDFARAVEAAHGIK